MNIEDVIVLSPRYDSHIEIKTVHFKGDIKKNVQNGFYTLQSKMKGPSGPGYCNKTVSNMNKVSNQAFCKTKTNSNIGYWYRITFPVGTENTRYCFRNPTDFAKGGIVFADGKKVIETSADMWEGGHSKKLDFCHTFKEVGNHQLDYYGAEKCCDGTTKWFFCVKGYPK